MATCPDCGANSRNDAGFAIEDILVAQPIGDFSVAGQQMKVSAKAWLRLSHSCGWNVLGWVEGGDFVAPSSEVQTQMREADPQA